MAKKKGTRDRKKSDKKIDKGKSTVKFKEDELREMKSPDLLIIAKELGYKGGRMKKEECIEFILDPKKGKNGSDLADAVTDVIGKKEEKKVPKKYNTLLLKWTADGYDVKELEELMKTANLSEIKTVFKKFEEAISTTDLIRSELEGMDLKGFSSELEELNDLLADPNMADESTARFETLKLKKKANVMRKELDKMVLPSMRDRVETLRNKLDDLENIDEFQKELDVLKVEYKESYFIDGVVSDVKGTKPVPTARPTRIKREVRGAAPMLVKDIFLLYKDGRFISHHTSRPVSKEEQTKLFADLKIGRNYLRSPKYIPQKLNTIPVDGRKIVVQSGSFTVVIMIVDGDVNPWTERIIGKVLVLMEKEDLAALRSWTGDVASLKSSGKYMQALLFACMKLAKGKKA